MAEQKLRLDIRIIKFQDYIRRKPDRPFGYYGIGVLYMLSGKPSVADKMFTHALKINPDYTPAKLGKLEYFLSERKYISAARYYKKNADSFSNKRIYIVRIERITSQLYLTRGFYRYAKRFIRLVSFSEKLGFLQRMFSSGSDNPVASLLLAMFYLKHGNKDNRAQVLYNLCVGMEGINDRLRWDLVKAISEQQPAILKDAKIGGLFKNIPDSAIGNEYTDFLASLFIAQQNQEKVLKAFSVFHKRHALPDKKVLWKYLHFCYKRDLSNPALV
ncbi:MAG: hypothetical protein GX757_10825, partial [Clostridiales bacterium]|nr:hypothetical protein [Clostridiales bacterium]